MDTPIRLDICKGVQAAIGDTETAEHGYEAMSLINPAGISLDTNGWTMAFASLKNGGLWSDSALSDGRMLVAGAQANVTETLRCLVGNPDMAQRQAIIKKLRLYIQNARDFWQDCGQIEPVYLALHAAGAAAEQFALIYNIELATDTDPYDCHDPWSFTLTIEREPAWRIVVPPGGNPRVYEYWRNNRIPSVNYGMTELQLFPDGNFAPPYAVWDSAYRICAEGITNCFEWGGGGTDRTTYITKNYVDIDASKIPGDMPARVYLSVSPFNLPTSKVMVSRYTGPRTFYGRDSNATHLARNLFPAADAIIGGVSAVAHDACGLKAANDAANGHIATYTAPTPMAAFVRVLQWDATQLISVNEFRGTWAIFLRCQQIAGTQNDVQIRFVLEHGNAAGDVGAQCILDPQYMPQVTPVAACTEFRWAYLGQVTIPLSNHSFSSQYGYGLEQYGNASDSIWFSIEVKNLAAGTRDLEFLDLALMPIHEAFVMFDATNSTQGKRVSSNTNIIYDGTGYTAHGNPDPISAYSPDIDSPHGLAVMQYKGASLALKPGVNNRLYFIAQNYYVVGGYEVSTASAQYLIRASIVPSCAGISDVEPLA